jgi:hypothetical protein
VSKFVFLFFFILIKKTINEALIYGKNVFCYTIQNIYVWLIVIQSVKLLQEFVIGFIQGKFFKTKLLSCNSHIGLFVFYKIKVIEIVAVPDLGTNVENWASWNHWFLIAPFFYVKNLLFGKLRINLEVLGCILSNKLANLLLTNLSINYCFPHNISIKHLWTNFNIFFYHFFSTEIRIDRTTPWPITITSSTGHRQKLSLFPFLFEFLNYLFRHFTQNSIFH